MRVFISGAYSAPTEEERIANVNAAIDAALILQKRGHTTFIPHLFHWVDKRAQETGVPMTYNDYTAWDNEFLKMCDALLFLGPSPGALAELELAEKIGLIVLYPEDLRESANEYDW